MATALEVINRAGRRAAILAGEEAWISAEADDQLQLLNDMMHNFPARGIKYAHTTLALGDTVNIPDGQLRNLILLLAREMAIDYAKELTLSASMAIDRAERELQAAYWITPDAIVDPLLTANGYVRGGNVRTV